MNDYMRALHQRFFREPDVSELEEDIENTRQEVRDCLDKMQRRRLMHLVDTQNLLREETSLASGVDAKTLSGILGHTNASFTLDTYTHVTPDMQRAASDVVGGFLKNLLGEELNPWQGNEKAEPAP